MGMELSDELFADIRKSLKLGAGDTGDATATASAGAGTARRAGRMDAAQVKVAIEHVGALQGRHAITLLDVGKRGVSFVDDRAWGAGEKFVIHLPRSARHVI